MHNRATLREIGSAGTDIVDFAVSLLRCLLPMDLTEEQQHKLASQTLAIRHSPRHRHAGHVFNRLSCASPGAEMQAPGGEDDLATAVGCLAKSDQRALMQLCLEAALARPSHGGNPEGACWQALGYRPPQS